MNKVLTFILLILLFSCDPYRDKDIQGDWILAYYITIVDQEEWQENHCGFVSIEGSEWRSLECKRPDMGLDSQERTLKFNRKNDKLYFSNSKDRYLKLIAVSEDSMVIQNLDTTQNMTFVYKRLPAQTTANWNPLKKSYRFNGNNGQAYWDFFNDSLMIEHRSEQRDYRSKEWWTEKFKDYTFLVINQIDSPQPILVDSLALESTYVSVIDSEVNHYVMEKIEPNDSISKKLIGTWKQSNEGAIPKPPESLAFQFEQFEVTKDSILAGDKLSQLKTKWIISGNRETIFFPIEKSRLLRHWRIKELTNERLVLDMPDVFLFDRPGGNRENRVIRTYKKTTGNKGYNL